MQHVAFSHSSKKVANSDVVKPIFYAETTFVLWTANLLSSASYGQFLVEDAVTVTLEVKLSLGKELNSLIWNQTIPSPHQQ